MDNSFAGRLRQLCNDYYSEYMDTPPCPVSSYTRMNSLLEGTRKPTMNELVKISEAFDVSININTLVAVFPKGSMDGFLIF